ncbi:uncharacterized protein B0H18DRAFT_523350 [Fomitopsis serialis]|uniref:uncharacterized protein n=1 Tax=Fomitopsis serialis TaxID=139415 RepID=UPI00200721E1|nr:uncharacterized protein B0H18DRAFT_523350 [Neoantrodia serialis]KAH9922233.1 hypothetical protein B0H18DRAFT_523350 [Neoantrodia serialis]
MRICRKPDSGADLARAALTSLSSSLALVLALASARVFAQALSPVPASNHTLRLALAPPLLPSRRPRLTGTGRYQHVAAASSLRSGDAGLGNRSTRGRSARAWHGGRATGSSTARTTTRRTATTTPTRTGQNASAGTVILDGTVDILGGAAPQRHASAKDIAVRRRTCFAESK